MLKRNTRRAMKGSIMTFYHERHAQDGDFLILYLQGL